MIPPVAFKSRTDRTRCLHRCFLDREEPPTTLPHPQCGHGHSVGAGKETVAHCKRSCIMQLEKRFKVMWADHGDMLSTQYAGTGALKSGFTRTGKRTLLGLIDDGLKSCVRYYLNNYEDGQKQDAYDLVTGAFQPGQVCVETAPWEAQPPLQAAGPIVLICWTCFPYGEPHKQKFLWACRLPLLCTSAVRGMPVFDDEQSECIALFCAPQRSAFRGCSCWGALL